ncbi:MAG TPA: alpha/beta fold hydrolase [Limnobacter sp.]|nr:alpha/beta fold hydrolase [Limnobacter sp.]
MRPFEVVIPAQGQSLAGSFFPAASGSSQQPVLICPATGILQKFYFPFASWLASQGFSVLVFDYRGIGGSLQERHVRHCGARKQDWGLLDMPAALDFLLELTGQGSAILIGHSAGGQLFGLMHNHAKVRGVIAVAASSGHVENIRKDKRTAARMMLDWFIPVTSTVLGYVPAKRIGWGENLPAGVGRQWAKWCSRPGYVENDFADSIPKHWYSEFNSPIVFVHASDDEIATRPNVEDIMRLFPGARKNRIELTPADFGLGKVGHMNVLREPCKKIWPRLLREMKAMI